MPEPGHARLRYIDWLRGLACLGMIEVHAYDAWLNGSGRASTFFRQSQFSGTIPAPLFMFLAGIAAALLMDRMRRKGAPAGEIAARLIRRGAQIFGLGMLFRIQEFLLGLPKAPWTDLLRVDVLNMFGLSIAFMGVLCWMVRTRAKSVIFAAATATSIALATPLLWTTWRPRWLPWYLESYINGVHIYGSPQPWLFPMFPWMAFAFAGLAAGFLLSSEWSAANPSRTMLLLAGAGVGLFALSVWLEALPVRIYPVHDYWHTSPNFFLARLGTLSSGAARRLLVVPLGAGARRFQPSRPTRADVPARLLGAHGICVWPVFDFDTSRADNSHGHARCCRGLRTHVAAVARANALEGAWRGNSRAARPASLGIVAARAAPGN